jgi:hypothetical protein
MARAGLPADFEASCGKDTVDATVLSRIRKAKCAK